MIPKIIHYCWLSDDPIPLSIKNYMDTWKKYLPDYTFINWNFTKFSKESSTWVSQAFDYKKYAFAADYIRLYALYNYGGIYLDTDVEVLKQYEEKLLRLKTFICWEKDGSGLEVATFGVEKGASWVKICLDYYENKTFINKDGILETKVLPQVIKDHLINNNFELLDAKNIDDALSLESEKRLAVLPCEYFSPKSYLNGKINITDNTYSIHHFAGSWLSPKDRFIHKIASILKIGSHGYFTKIKIFFNK